jgi:hypothetical protein
MMREQMCRFVRKSMICLIGIVTGGIFLLPLMGAEDYKVQVLRVAGRIQIDGILDEEIWQGSASAIHLTQVEPHPGEPPTEGTSVWLAQSREALYVAVRCEDHHPDQIVATEMRRDAMLMDNDNIEMILDTYHDHRNAYFFSTNAAGALVDGRITENQMGSTEWDGIWNVRTHIDDKGWTAEFEIPFKTIGFNHGLSEWGFNISRFRARGRELSRWASPSLDTMIFQIVKAGNIAGIDNPSQGVGLDIKPYGIVGFTRDIERRNILRPSGKKGEDPLQAARKAGADVFYRITSNLVSSTTINTDFAETEVDTRQVNLTRFQLFFPEKRSFFLEDAGIFEFAKAPSSGPPGFDMGGDLLPFFSRNMGMVQVYSPKTGLYEGYEVPIRVGEKLTGKIGRFDIGLLDVQTGSHSEPDRADQPGFHLASRNLSVGRIKANFLSQSYIGAMFTNGDPNGRVSNQMGGIDFKLATSNFLNQGKNLSLMLFGTRTRTTNIEGRDTSYGGVLSYPNDFLDLQYKWMNIGENYYPALGFVPRTGVRISSINGEIAPRPEFWNIRRMSFEFSYTDYYSTAHDDWETKELVLTPFQWRMNSGDFIGYDWTRSQEQLFYPWTISTRKGITLPTGKYDFNSHGFYFMSSQSRQFSVQSSFGTGSFFSGTRRRYDAELTWRRSRHFATSFRIEQNWIDLKEGHFSTSLAMYRLDYSFTPFITLANFVQYDTDSRNIGLQSRLRWILQPGNEFFIVLNHGWQENDLDRFESAQTRFRVKLNYTFRF